MHRESGVSGFIRSYFIRVILAIDMLFMIYMNFSFGIPAF